MLQALEHRGPDARGLWSNGPAQLGVARLAIVDPAATASPLTNEAGTLRLAFNGEIYNHRELRVELERRGHSFATRTDSEVIVHLYEEEGAACVHRLRGMFAFAILDGDQLLLARDRLGIKPLYYSVIEPSGLFLFGSEIKALLRCDSLDPRLDMQSFADRVILGHAVSTRTYIEGIDSLAPGHTLTVWRNSDTLRVESPTRYFDPRSLRDEELAYENAELQLEEVFEDVIDRHLDADVEVGVALSGGLDSTMLALLAQARCDRPLQSFAVGDFEGNPDVRMSAQVASMIGTSHHTSVIAFDEYLASIPRFVATEEQPSSLIGMPFYLLSQRIGESLKACLCGEGADELFGGYSDYVHRELKVSSLTRRLPALERLGIGLSHEAAELLGRLTSAQSPEEYLDAIFEVNLGDPLERLHLDGVDKNAMAHGLEMRVPYLDDRLYDLVASFPLRFRVRPELGIRKYVLRRLCLRRFGEKFLDVILREKVGVPSAGLGLVRRFDRLCDQELADDYLDRHELGYCFATKRHLLTFEMFQDIFLSGAGDPAVVGNVLEYMQSRAGVPATSGAA